MPLAPGFPLSRELRTNMIGNRSSTSLVARFQQVAGSSRALDKEYPMLWKILFIDVIFGLLADRQPFALSE
jgi:hypothetical protein